MGDFFSLQSDKYKSYRPTYPDELYNTLVEKISGNARVWDCATGNGQFALYLADHVNEIYATDISVNQLSLASHHPSIFYSCQSAEETNFQNSFFDLVTVAQALHWFDIDQFYKEVRRVLRPQGLIAIIGYGRILTDNSFSGLIDEFYSKMFGLFFTGNRHHVETEYRELDFPFEQIGFYKFESSYNWAIEDLRGYLQSWSAVQKYIETNGHDPTVPIIKKWRDKWGDQYKVRFPFFMKIGRIL